MTTLDDADDLNVAPMGPLIDPGLTTLTLRPFQTSRTYQNLVRRPYGVFHVTDDVLLLARAAIGQLEVLPETRPAERIAGRILTGACRWYEFEIVERDDSQERTRLIARVIHSGRQRDFLGFNRAKHAVLEAAILATRRHLIPRAEILEEYRRLKIPVEKTAGPEELAAFQLLSDYIAADQEP